MSCQECKERLALCLLLSNRAGVGCVLRTECVLFHAQGQGLHAAKSYHIHWLSGLAYHFDGGHWAMVQFLRYDVWMTGEGGPPTPRWTTARGPGSAATPRQLRKLGRQEQRQQQRRQEQAKAEQRRHRYKVLSRCGHSLISSMSRLFPTTLQDLTPIWHWQRRGDSSAHPPQVAAQS